MRLRPKEVLLAATIIICGIFLRYIHLEKTAYFNADQEDFAWTAVRIIQDYKPTLIGIKAGEFPIFIGPLMYYIYALFYLLFSWNPIGLSYFHLLVSVLTLSSVFFVATKLMGKTTGFLALFIYAFSFFFIDWDRRVWLPTLLIITSIWAFYSLALKQWYFLGFLLSLAFQLHLTGLILWPIALFNWIIYRQQFKFTTFVRGLILGLIGFIPVIIFDLRHNWLNVKGWLSLIQFGHQKLDILDRLSFLFNLTAGNALGILSFTSDQFARTVLILMFVLWSLNLARHPAKNYLLQRLIWLWLVVPILVFLPLHISIPEYYLALTFPILLILIALGLCRLALTPLGKIFVAVSLIFFASVNLHQFFTENLEEIISLYHKKQLVNYIISTSKTTDFSVNYLTAPGYRYGFDYLFYQQIHSVPSDNHRPDFTIVVPWNYDQLPLSRKFGGLGVINHQKI